MIKISAEMKKTTVVLIIAVIFILAAGVGIYYLGLVDLSDYNLLPLFGLYAVVVSASAFVVWLIVLILKSARRGRVKHVLSQNGYSAEFFERAEKYAKRPKSGVLYAKKRLWLAESYIDGRRYESAHSVLKDIDLTSFNTETAAKYYLTYAYLFLITGDFDGAEATLKMGKPFTDKLAKNRYKYAQTYLVNGIMKYARGNYEKAEKSFDRAISSGNRNVEITALLYKGLVCLRLGRKDDAKDIVVKLGNMKKTHRQSEDLLKLIKKVEKAYTI